MLAFRQQPMIAASILIFSLLAINTATESFAAPAAPVAAAPGLDGLRAELALQYDHDGAERSFYQARDFQPIWIDDDGRATPAARTLLSWVGQADANALPASRYDVPGLMARLATTGPDSDAAELEALLTRLFLTYARDISSGLLEPRKIDSKINIDPQRPDPATLLLEISAASDPAAFLDALAPADPAYDRLVALYAQMRQTVRDGGWGSLVEKGTSLRLEVRNPRVAQLRARLVAMGDLAATSHLETSSLDAPIKVASADVVNDATPDLADPQLFGPGLDTAVRAFQLRHGLKDDGVVGPATLAALNTTAIERAQQIAVNLERLRWLNGALGEKYIIVNTAGYDMAVFEDGKKVFSSIVIVGRAKQQTPEFSDQMEYMVVNPTWYVPRSLAGREILPLLKRDPDYLQRKNMSLIGADASTIDWSTVTPATFPGKLQQAPGPGNALGKVKFMFPNDFAIYLHDTPGKNLFKRESRAYSNGCVRVKKPFEFAQLLLAGQEDDPAAAFDRWSRSKREIYVKLRQPVPVHITYRTAWVGDDGTQQFRADVYDRDRKVIAALTADGISISGG